LCNWGLTLKQSSAVHIQALYPADVILPGSGSKLRLLVINLASVPAVGQFSTAQKFSTWAKIVSPCFLGLRNFIKHSPTEKSFYLFKLVVD
jgi:hypothetical protein